MAITKLTANVQNHAAQVDEPNDIGGLTAAQFKDICDKGAVDIKEYINNTLTEELDTLLYSPGGTTAEVIAARGDYPVLDDRLDNVDLQLAEIPLYAKNFGVKLDGVTDDTVALNNFFQMFGNAELIVNGGVALISGPLYLEGKWSPNTGANSHRKLKFVNASIKYVGTAGQPCMHIYNHQLSSIEGLAITRDSNDTYVNFASYWYSKVENFDLPNMCFNKINSNIPDTLLSTASFVNSFSKGYIRGRCEFHGVGVTGATQVNSMTFKDVLFDGSRGSQDYNFKFYGTSFENFSFDGCDISYAAKSIFYIDTTQTTAMFNFSNSYFDTAIPIIENQDFKGSIINMANCNEASGTISQMALVKTKNILSSSKIGVASQEANSIPIGVMNLIKNGDLLKPSITSDWITFQNSGGGNVVAALLSNSNTLNGKSLNIPFTTALQGFTFLGLNAPAEGRYVMGLRLKKVSGSATIQINFGATYVNYDLSKYADGEEIIITNRSSVKTWTQSEQLWFSVIALTTGFSATTIEILEAVVLQGSYVVFNLPVHPRAVVYRKNIINAGLTSARPTSPVLGELYFDQNLDYVICYNGAAWKNSVGATV